jgi:hypothetical protein
VGGVRVPTEVIEALVKSADRRTAFASSVARNIRDADLNGVEIDFRLDARGVSKQSKGGLVALAKVWPSPTITEPSEEQWLLYIPPASIVMNNRLFFFLHNAFICFRRFNKHSNIKFV